MKITALVLAAGSSSRLGTAKQCLPFEGRSFLQRTLRTLLDSHVQRVMAVLGANAEVCRAHIAELPVIQINNPRWQQGMANSIVAGLQAALHTEPDLDAVLIALCDQPLISPALINKIVALYDTSHCGMVGSQYGETLGVPALFDKTHFPDLLALHGDQGARTLLHGGDVQRVLFPGGGIDIDTREQYADFLAARSEAAAH